MRPLSKSAKGYRPPRLRDDKENVLIQNELLASPSNAAEVNVGTKNAFSILSDQSVSRTSATPTPESSSRNNSGLSVVPAADQPFNPPISDPCKVSVRTGSFKRPRIIQSNGGNSEAEQPRSVHTSRRVWQSSSQNPEGPSDGRYYKVLYHKNDNKKRKTYFDGILSLRGRRLKLEDMDGKLVSTLHVKSSSSYEVSGSYEMGFRWVFEVLEEIPAESYQSGRVFIQESSGASSMVTQPSAVGNKPFKSRTTNSRNSNMIRQVKDNMGPTKANSNRISTCSTTKRIVEQTLRPPELPKEFALAYTEPRGETSWTSIHRSHLAILRPHQKDAVKFLWGCLNGAAVPGNYGAILADEMGLGKTLTTISICWALLATRYRSNGSRLVCKIVIVVPSSLVQHWAKEFKKWCNGCSVADVRQVFVVVNVAGAEAKTKVQDFIASGKNDSCHIPPRSILIISYEMYRKTYDSINRASIGLIVCDEGHRLKNSDGNKTIQALSSSSCKRRLIITGTPIQNELEEFYAMANFVNPNILGPLKAFKTVFANPIERSRDKTATEETKTLGELRASELLRVTRPFVLRRTNEILKKFLPPKKEFVVFAAPSSLQVELYRHCLSNSVLRRLTQSYNMVDGAAALSLITSLRKLCNHPELVRPMCTIGSDEVKGNKFPNSAREESAIEDVNSVFQGAGIFFPDNYFEVGEGPKIPSSTMSGKMMVLDSLLTTIREECPNDRTVLLSNYTSTFDKVIEPFCINRGYKFLRLDGSTELGKRQELVESFSNLHNDIFLFLVSSKAGGVGLNLSAANRLILFDPAWNPAIDEQAMARVWRDGQKKDVSIYRILTTGTIEEKIYQRQLRKLEVAGSLDMRGPAKNSRNFSRSELMELFSIDLGTKCDTYDVMAGRKSKSRADGRPSSEADHSCEENCTWTTYEGPQTLSDRILRRVAEDAMGKVTFVHEGSDTATSTSPEKVKYETKNETNSLHDEVASPGDTDYNEPRKSSKLSKSANEFADSSPHTTEGSLREGVGIIVVPNTAEKPVREHDKVSISIEDDENLLEMDI